MEFLIVDQLKCSEVCILYAILKHLTSKTDYIFKIFSKNRNLTKNRFIKIKIVTIELNCGSITTIAVNKYGKLPVPHIYAS